MSGGGSSGGGSPANTTSVNTQIVDLPSWEQQYMTNLLGQSQAAASQPYQQFPGQQVAGFTPDQTQAFSNVENLVNNNTAGQIQNAGVGSALAGANSAQNIYGNASPYLNAAAQQGSAQGVQNYMSPFLNQEIQGLQTSAQQNWNQFTAPQINDAFIGAGQFGSGRNAQVIGQQASLADQALTGQIANAANSAYGTAGSLAQNQASNLANVGNSLGNLANTQAGTQANIGTALGALGNQVQNTGITGASALQDVGQQQQQLNQQNINTAMTNFQNQVQYPQSQLSWESNILHGLPSTTGTTGTQTGAMTNNVVGSVSPLSTLGGALIGTGGLANTNGSLNTAASGVTANKKGGLIQGFRFGGQVKGYSGEDGDSQVSIDPLTALFGNSLGDQNWQSPSSSNVDVDSQSGIPMDAPNPALMDAATDTSARAVLPPPAPSQQQTTSAPPPSHTDDYQKPSNDNPLTMIKAPSMPQFDPEQQRGYQLLAMAKGLLTPAHSGAEALGNALGNYAQTGMDQQKWMAEMQAKYAPMQIEAAKANNEAQYQQGELGNTAAMREIERQRLAQESDYQSGELKLREQQIQNEARNQMLERQKPISDGLGGFMQLDPETNKYKPIDSSGLTGTDGNSVGRGIGNLYNVPKDANGNELTGSAFLATLPPQIEAQAQSYISGNSVPPTGFATKPMLLAAYQAAQKADPNFNQVAGTRAKTIQDFTNPNGKTAQTIKSQNVTMEHISTLKDAVDALHNGDMKAWNLAVNTIADQTGQPAPNNFELGRNLVSDEITKAVLGTSGAVTDREAIKKSLSLNASPTQALGALDEAGKYMAGQARGLEQTYYSGTKMDNYRDRFMSPQAQALISKYYPSKVGEQPASGGTNGTAKSSAATHRYNPATGKVEAIQ